MNVEIIQEFSKDILTQDLPEWLEMNSLGAYSSSTILGLNNRRQHGLFVVRSQTSSEKILMLSKFEETVFIDNQAFEISSNEYVGGVYPEGHIYLTKFTINPFPTFTYSIKDRKIEKSVILLHNKNLLMIRFRLLNQGSPVKLILKPLIACRKINELTANIQGINTDSYTMENMVTLSPRVNYPDLKIYFNRGDYTPAPLWYHNYLYKNDIPFYEKKYEDLLNPGFFTFYLQPYESFDVFITNEIWQDFDFEGLYRNEKEFRKKTFAIIQNSSDVIKDLAKKAEILNFHIPEMPQIISVSTVSRNTMRGHIISQYCNLVLNPNQVLKFIEKLTAHIKDGLFHSDTEKNNASTQILPDADSVLFLINLAYAYYTKTKNKKLLSEKLYDAFAGVITAFQKGTHFNIYIDRDQLLFAGDKENAVSWLPKFANGQQPRYGKLLENNALWYNALCVMAFFSEELGKNRYRKKYEKLANNFKISFLKEFFTEGGYCYDALLNSEKIDEFRLTQIITIGLPFSMMDENQAVKILSKIEQELYTPFGLRTLADSDSNFKAPDRVERKNPDFYDGAILPWSLGIYVDAVLKYRGTGPEIVNELYEKFTPVLEMYKSKSLGFIPEIMYEKDPRLISGELVNKLNFSEILRALCKLESFKKKNAKK